MQAFSNMFHCLQINTSILANTAYNNAKTYKDHVSHLLVWLSLQKQVILRYNFPVFLCHLFFS